jgi:hypothetical protein
MRRSVWALAGWLLLQVTAAGPAAAQSENEDSSRAAPEAPAPETRTSHHRYHRRHHHRHHTSTEPPDRPQGGEPQEPRPTHRRHHRHHRRRHHRRRQRRHRRRHRHRAVTAVEPPFEGPRFEAGWRFYTMTDFHDQGAVNALDFTIFPLRGKLRLGATVEAALRRDDPDDDVVLRAVGSIGYQSPGRVTPFVVATLGLGTVGQKRFHITEWSVLGSVGLECGAEVRLGSAFRFGGSVGVQRVLTSGVRYDSLTLQLAIGF